jgi:hypothetical protein
VSEDGGDLRSGGSRKGFMAEYAKNFQIIDRILRVTRIDRHVPAIYELCSKMPIREDRMFRRASPAEPRDRAPACSSTT